MPHNFRVLNLREPNQIEPLDALNPDNMEPRLTVFVMHHDWLNDPWEIMEFYRPLNQFLCNHTHEKYVDKMPIAHRIYIRFNPTKPEILAQFCQEVCLWQNEPQQIFLFLNGITYRTLLRTGLQLSLIHI